MKFSILDGKLKAVISNYNEKYVFSDAYIDEDKKILTIFTKKCMTI